MTDAARDAIEGTISAVGDAKEVSTQYGTSDLAELTVETETGPEQVTCWGKWTETTAVAEPGMRIRVTNPEEREYQGDVQYSTTGDSYVVLEPQFLVDVTDVREYVQCPRMYYLNKLSSAPLKYPVIKGTIVHEVFGDLLRGVDFDDAVDDRVEEAGLDLGLLGMDAEEVREEVAENARAIDAWLSQGKLSGDDEWRSEMTLISETFGIKGRADAVRNGMPVELKTGKNLKRDPRFEDKIQAASYALLLRERGVEVDTATLLYTKNAALDRSEFSGDFSPAKEFSVGDGLLKYVVRARNAIAGFEYDFAVPTGYEADAVCEYCFEQDTCRVVAGRLDQESKAGQIGRKLPDDELEYYEDTYRAIEEERVETHEEYAKLWEQTPAERAEDDRALVDLEFESKRERADGRWELRARRTSAAVSKLREDDLVLASDGDPVQGDAELAYIERLGDDEVVLSAAEPIAVSRIDVYPSEFSVSRMQVALHDALLKGDPDRKDVLFGRREPEFDAERALDPDRDPGEGGESTTEAEPETFVDNNAAQDEAVRKAVTAEDVALVHGPPGTGKTYTIGQAVRAMVARGERVLLSAFTNRAVDNALEALEEQGFTDFVRVGTESGIRDDMLGYRLETRGDPEECAARLQDAQVVAATTATCGSRVMREQRFDAALVDEAGQLTEPDALAAVNLAERFVLVGDHQQLPPVVRAENELQESLFERLVERYPEAGVMLDRQYRMSQRIQAFASAAFYDGKLRPATGEVAAQHPRQLVDLDDLPAELRDGVTFLDTPGDGGRNTDAVEAERVADVVSSYLAAGVAPEDVGVIAPFRAQVAEITRRVPESVTVDTVDRFQGSSKEVIVVSFVASGDLESPIFEDYRRVNVALTRAKRALVLVGDADALATDPVYGRMVDWSRPD
ncbi:AAA domain-containing protein [Halorubellus salinus]|uniref:AAA domain-containing protein n=1 Tax=Halorubellus salinus TaxID=755309 RepID=UPI001D076D84